MSGQYKNLYMQFRSQFAPGPIKKHARAWSKGFLSGVGAFVMRAARGSLRPSKKSAEPGNPPRVHTKGGRKSQLKAIFFAVEGVHNVVIGPVLMARATSGAGRGSHGVFIQSDKTVPELLEYGGTAYAVVRSGETFDVGRGRSRRTLSRTVRKVTMHYRKFPFMHPALGKGLADFQKKRSYDATPEARVSF